MSDNNLNKELQLHYDYYDYYDYDKHDCSCGGSFLGRDYKKHIKSRKHILFFKNPPKEYFERWKIIWEIIGGETKIQE
jgi:hypothetical protein